MKIETRSNYKKLLEGFLFQSFKLRSIAFYLFPNISRYFALLFGKMFFDAKLSFPNVSRDGKINRKSTLTRLFVPECPET